MFASRTPGIFILCIALCISANSIAIALESDKSKTAESGADDSPKEELKPGKSKDAEQARDAEMQAEPELKDAGSASEAMTGETTEAETSASEDDIPRLLKEANAASHHNNFQEAITLCDQVLKLKPDDMQATATRGAAYVSLGKFKEGIADLTKALDTLKNPSLHSLYGARALAYLQLNEYDKSIDDISNSLKVKTDNQQYWLIRGAAYHKSKDYKRAIADFNKGLALDPEGPNATVFLTGRSDSLAAMGRDDDCLKDLSKIVKLAPKDPSAWMNRAMFYVKAKDWQKAVTDLDNVIDFAPMGRLSNEALILRAEANKNCGKYQESIRDFTSLLAGYPKEPSFLYGRAEANLSAGDKDLALKDINKCIDQIKTDGRYFDLRAKIYDALNRPDEARSDRDTALKLNADKAGTKNAE